jgi:hypothetical protein
LKSKFLILFNISTGLAIYFLETAYYGFEWRLNRIIANAACTLFTTKGGLLNDLISQIWFFVIVFGSFLAVLGLFLLGFSFFLCEKSISGWACIYSFALDN